MGFDKDAGFRRYLEKSGNIYDIVQKVQREARELASQYNDKILHSEAITHIMRGTVPEHRCYFSDEYEAKEIREMFCYIDDVEVQNAVYDSFYESKKRNNLYYIYNGITDAGRRARVRVLTRMLWHQLIEGGTLYD